MRTSFSKITISRHYLCDCTSALTRMLLNGINSILIVGKLCEWTEVKSYKTAVLTRLVWLFDNRGIPRHVLSATGDTKLSCEFSRKKAHRSGVTNFPIIFVLELCSAGEKWKIIEKSGKNVKIRLEIECNKLEILQILNGLIPTTLPFIPTKSMRNPYSL